MEFKKSIRKLLSAASAVVLTTALSISAFAASTATATIDTSRKGSIEIYKYDVTSAVEDGAWNNSYVATGNAIDDNGNVKDQLGTGSSMTDQQHVSNKGYAIQGVKFKYAKVADIIQKQNGTTIELMYRFADASLEDALSLSGEKTAQDINKALNDKLVANRNDITNKLEDYIRVNGGKDFAETDADGHTKVEGLDLGLYLVVETEVPETVVATTAPFFISLPMTTHDGSGNDEWLYDVTVYPKNATGVPTLEKVLREANVGKDYSHTDSASISDIVDYKISSNIPEINTKASFLTKYTFTDKADKGIAYNKDTVVSIYSDSTMTTNLASWGVDDGMFTATYAPDNSMVIAFTANGLLAINQNYANCFMVITYTATVDTDAVLGDTGNHNNVTLEYVRTNTAYYGTLTDECHLYTYGINLNKRFGGDSTDFSKVTFSLQNKTDGFYLVASLADGVYTITGTTTDESVATKFSPNAAGLLQVRGLEPDEYIVTELTTAEGYQLLKENVSIVIRGNADRVCAEGHDLLSGSATVNGTAAGMSADSGSANALTELTVVNNQKTDIPAAGDNGIFTAIIGATLGAIGFFMIKKSKRSECAAE